MAIKAWKQGRSKEDDYIVEGLSGQQKVKLSTEWRTAVNNGTKSKNKTTPKQKTNINKHKKKKKKNGVWVPAQSLRDRNTLDKKTKKRSGDSSEGMIQISMPTITLFK